MSPRREMLPGNRGRGSVFTYTWRGSSGRQLSRKAGDTLEQAEASSAASTTNWRWAPAGPPRR